MSSHSLTFDMASGASLQNQQQSLSAHIKTLINHDLREICRGEGLAVSGVKSQLQNRVINYLDGLIQRGDHAQLAILRHRIYNHGSAPSSTSTLPSVPSTSGVVHNSTSTFGMTNGHGPLPTPGSIGHRPLYNTWLRFKDSPFYEVREPLTKTLDMPAYQSHRNTLALTLTLTQPYVDKLRGDSSLRVLLYCAADRHQPADIAFPQQLEIKVNSEEVKANFKGLKNKPGSTRPADITGFIRKQTAYANNIMVTYALTHKTFYLVALLVKKHSVEELAERIENRSVISKQRVINEMVMKANDPDVVATSSVMSLKDPISYTRIALPCRSTICTHNQCFDASSFLQLQEQAPTWTCPICNKVVAFEGLAVDQYVQEILQATPRSVEQVTIEPNGKWSYSNTENSKSGTNGVKNEPYDDDEDDEDDDLIEITDNRRRSLLKTDTPNTPFSLNAFTPSVPSPATPSIAASAVSTASGPRPGQKRKSEVIDLTLSDEDEPAIKRPSYNTPNSLPDRGPGRNGYQPYPSNSSNRAPPANGMVSFQIMRPSVSNSTHNNSTSYSPPSLQHPSPLPLAGTPLAPINLTSSPNRPSPVLPDYSTSISYQNQQRPPPPQQLPPFPPPPQVSRQNSGSSSNPAQRATLLGLAGRSQDYR